MAKGRSFLWLATVVLLPLIAFVAHQTLFEGVDQPPSDHGSGSMFDMIAGRYDAINRVLALGMDTSWRVTMVKFIQQHVRKGMNIAHPRILDVSTGTADVALLLASAMPEATILGIDPSSNMLDVGRTKIQKRGKGNQVTLELHDARDLSKLENETFDAATMAFGIRNVPERGQALCEIHSLLRDNARFCILEFSEPDESFGVMGMTVRFFIRHVIPFLGGILSGAPREYWHLQKSINEFPSPKEFVEQIHALQCDGGAYHVDQVHQIMFGSVQIYSMRSLKSDESSKEEATE